MLFLTFLIVMIMTAATLSIVRCFGFVLTILLSNLNDIDRILLAKTRTTCAVLRVLLQNNLMGNLNITCIHF